MERESYVVSFEQEPPALLQQLEQRLAQQGDPRIAVRRLDDHYVFEAHTAEFMIRARAAYALEDAFPGWRRALRR